MAKRHKATGSFWMDNAISEKDPGGPKHILLDLGYVKAQVARDRADRICAVLGSKPKRHVEIAGFGRLLLRIPPTKFTEVIWAFPEIEARPGYCWTTHRWLEGDVAELKYAMS